MGNPLICGFASLYLKKGQVPETSTLRENKNKKGKTVRVLANSPRRDAAFSILNFSSNPASFTTAGSDSSINSSCT